MGKRVLIFTLLTFTYYLQSCNNKSSEVSPDTELRVTVRGINNQILNPVKIAIFDNQAGYTAAGLNFSITNAVYFDSTSNGTSIFPGVKAGKNYWIAAYYKDYTTFQSPIKPDLFIYHDNSTQGYELIRPLNQGSISSITLTLKPAESFVTFYSDNSDPHAFPISVRFGSDSLAPLTQPLNGIPVIYQSNTVTLKVKQGTYPYFTNNNSNCSSIEKIIIPGGESIAINTTCASGVVAFWSDTTNRKVLPISISLNINSDIGNLRLTLPSVPQDCNNNSVIKYSLPAGEYTYFAKTTTDSCAWTGKFTVLAKECNIIQLQKCH